MEFNQVVEKFVEKVEEHNDDYLGVKIIKIDQKNHKIVVLEEGQKEVYSYKAFFNDFIIHSTLFVSDPTLYDSIYDHFDEETGHVDNEGKISCFECSDEGRTPCYIYPDQKKDCHYCGKHLY